MFDTTSSQHGDLPETMVRAIKQPAFAGGFRVDPIGLIPFSDEGPDMHARGLQSLEVLKALAALVSDPYLVSISEAGRNAVYIAKGGFLVEGNGSLNLGLLRMMARDGGAEVRLDADAPCTNALINLANWLETIEADRLVEVSAGAQRFQLLARQRRFVMTGGGSVQTLASRVTAAHAEGAAVQLRYLERGDEEFDGDGHNACALFGAPKDQTHWDFDPSGALQAFPTGAEMPTIRKMVMLSDAFTGWCKDADAQLRVWDADGRVTFTADARKEGLNMEAFLP